MRNLARILWRRDVSEEVLCFQWLLQREKLCFRSMLVGNRKWEVESGKGLALGSLKCALRLRYNTFDFRICAAMKSMAKLNVFPSFS